MHCYTLSVFSLKDLRSHGPNQNSTSQLSDFETSPLLRPSRNPCSKNTNLESPHQVRPQKKEQTGKPGLLRKSDTKRFSSAAAVSSAGYLAEILEADETRSDEDPHWNDPRPATGAPPQGDELGPVDAESESSETTVAQYF